MSAWSNSTLPMIATFGQVVDELRPLVEEGAVVLVALDHEVAAARQPVAAPEVDRHAADQERRVEPGPVQQEGEQARGRGLAVRARDHQRRPRPQELLGQERRQAREALARGRAPPPPRGCRARARCRSPRGRRPRARSPRPRASGSGCRAPRAASTSAGRRPGRSPSPRGPARAAARPATPWPSRRWPRGGSSLDRRLEDGEATPPRPGTRAGRAPRTAASRWGAAVWPLERPRATGTSKPSSASSRISSSR